MKARKELLTQDDWALMVRELKSQRVQSLLHLETLEAALKRAMDMEKLAPPAPKPDTDSEGDPIDKKEETVFNSKETTKYVSKPKST